MCGLSGFGDDGRDDRAQRLGRVHDLDLRRELERLELIVEQLHTGKVIGSMFDAVGEQVTRRDQCNEPNGRQSFIQDATVRRSKCRACENDAPELPRDQLVVESFEPRPSTRVVHRNTVPHRDNVGGIVIVVGVEKLCTESVGDGLAHCGLPHAGRTHHHQ